MTSIKLIVILYVNLAREKRNRSGNVVASNNVWNWLNRMDKRKERRRRRQRRRRTECNNKIKRLWKRHVNKKQKEV